MTVPGRISATILWAASAVCVPLTALATPSECQDAISAYKSAKSDIATALQSYQACISGGDGHDDCSTEFEQLKSAQDDLEDAVSNYETECN
jgi:hypothetical protein